MIGLDLLTNASYVSGIVNGMFLGWLVLLCVSFVCESSFGRNDVFSKQGVVLGLFVIGAFALISLIPSPFTSFVLGYGIVGVIVWIGSLLLILGGIFYKDYSKAMESAREDEREACVETVQSMLRREDEAVDDETVKSVLNELRD